PEMSVVTRPSQHILHPNGAQHIPAPLEEQGQYLDLIGLLMNDVAQHPHALGERNRGRVPLDEAVQLGGSITSSVGSSEIVFIGGDGAPAEEPIGAADDRSSKEHERREKCTPLHVGRPHGGLDVKLYVDPNLLPV